MSVRCNYRSKRGQCDGMTEHMISKCGNFEATRCEKCGHTDYHGGRRLDSMA